MGYDHPIVRDFIYYTGIIFEIYAKKNNISTRSIAGGGRYDKLVESYGGSPVSAVGFGMGDVILSQHIESKKTKQSVPRSGLILCTTDENSVLSGYIATRNIRNGLPISFVGFVNEGKLSDLYKKSDSENKSCVVSYNGSSYTIRDLEKRKDAVCKNEKDLISKLKKYNI